MITKTSRQRHLREVSARSQASIDAEFVRLTAAPELRETFDHAELILALEEEV
jgi:hypothetical protein